MCVCAQVLKLLPSSKGHAAEVFQFGMEISDMLSCELYKTAPFSLTNRENVIFMRSQLCNKPGGLQRAIQNQEEPAKLN